LTRWRPSLLTPFLGYAAVLELVFPNRVRHRRSITWVIGSDRCFGSPIATLAVTNHLLQISLFPLGQDQLEKCQGSDGGSCAVPIVTRLFSRKAPMLLVLPMGFIAGWEASP